jgi:hypothetical protein
LSASCAGRTPRLTAMLAWCAAHTARRIFGSPRDLGLEGSLQRNPARRGAGLLAASFRHQPRQRGAQLEELLGGVLPHLPGGGRRAPRAFVVAADDGAVAIQMASALLLHMLQARAPRRALERWAPRRLAVLAPAVLRPRMRALTACPATVRRAYWAGCAGALAPRDAPRGR